MPIICQVLAFTARLLVGVLYTGRFHFLTLLTHCVLLSIFVISLKLSNPESCLLIPHCNFLSAAFSLVVQTKKKQPLLSCFYLSLISSVWLVSLSLLNTWTMLLSKSPFLSFFPSWCIFSLANPMYFNGIHRKLQILVPTCELNIPPWYPANISYLKCFKAKSFSLPSIQSLPWSHENHVKYKYDCYHWVCLKVFNGFTLPSWIFCSHTII